MLFRLSMVGGIGYALAGFAIVAAKHVGGMTPGDAGFMLMNACYFPVLLTELVLNSIALLDVAREREAIFGLMSSVPKRAGAGEWVGLCKVFGLAGVAVERELDDLCIGGPLQTGVAPAIRSLSLDIAGGEHVGVVGRTGSGKSSLLLALCRLVEAAAGSVVSDGIDISAISLQKACQVSTTPRARPPTRPPAATRSRTERRAQDTED